MEKQRNLKQSEVYGRETHLSPLFNLVLRTKGTQIVAYPDDIVIASKRSDIIQSMVEEIERGRNRMGLKINEIKTIFMRCGREDGSQIIKVGRHDYELVTLTNTEERSTEIKE